MRQGSNLKNRSRGRGSNNKKGSSIRTSSLDVTPSTRGRGNAHQLMDKYLALARDASAAGDRVLAENYFQYADHYYRVMSNAGNTNGHSLLQTQPQETPANQALEVNEGDGAEIVEDNTEVNKERCTEITDL